jgi:hypothetical protein
MAAFNNFIDTNKIKLTTKVKVKCVEVKWSNV